MQQSILLIGDQYNELYNTKLSSGTQRHHHHETHILCKNKKAAKHQTKIQKGSKGDNSDSILTHINIPITSQQSDIDMAYFEDIVVTKPYQPPTPQQVYISLIISSPH